MVDFTPTDGEGQSHLAAHVGHALPDQLLLNIRETYRKRQDLLRAELRLNLHIEANYRRQTGLTKEQRARLKKQASTGMGHRTGDLLHTAAQPADDGEGGDRPQSDTPTAAVPALAELLAAEEEAARWCEELIHGRDYYANARKPYEKHLEKLGRDLPVWPWVESVRGFGPLGLAMIVGECGDLALYANPAKVWKRMGLAVIDGERQGKRTDPEEALRHGYNPQRRSLMFVIADSLIKNNRDGAYRTYYLGEKARQSEKHPDDPPIAAHKRALRHLAKRLLRDLWREWRATLYVTPHERLPDHSPTGLAAD